MRRTSKPWRSRANDVLERLCWVGWFSFRYLGQVFLRYLRNMNVAQVFEGLGPFFLELSAICELKIYQSSTIHAISIQLTASSFCLFVTCRFFAWLPGQCDQTYPWHCEALSGLDVLKEMLSFNEMLVEVSTVEPSIWSIFWKC